MPKPSAKPRSRRRRIFIVDDHPLVREWLAGIIRNQPDLDVCGSAGDCSAALSGLRKARADALVVDISLETDSGLDLIRRAIAVDPELKVLVLSMHEEVYYAEQALKAGARGYVIKGESTAKIVEAIRLVLGGKIHLSETFMAKIAERFVRGGAAATGSPEEVLSRRELEVFRLLGSGRRTRDVAAQLKVSMKSIQVYRSRIKAKLNLRDGAELMREAVRWVEGNERKD
jgi:DNA-binding NarL/FixJ family response regulator